MSSSAEIDSVSVTPDNNVPKKPNTLTVAELCSAITKTIDEAFERQVWVEGVLSGISRSQNGHVYFDLVDSDETLGSQAKSVIAVTLFSKERAHVNKTLSRAGGTRMADGVKVRIRGQVNYYAPQGKVQLRMSQIDPEYTLGQMAADRTKLLAELKEKNLLDRNKLIPLPTLTLKVGVITSIGSAAYADFADEINKSVINFELVPIDCRTQGLDAVPMLVSAISTANDIPELDALVVVRGGGAKADLVAFDSRETVMAVTQCRLPVITGIGHEIDSSIMDEVAHKSCKTPTAAANFLIHRATKQQQLVADHKIRLHTLSQRAIEASTTNLAHLSHRINREATGALEKTAVKLDHNRKRILVAAKTAIDSHSKTLANSRSRLALSPHQIIESLELELKSLKTRVSALDPERSLERGYTITRNSNGDIVRSTDEVTEGTELTTHVKGGTIASVVSGRSKDVS